MHIWSNIALVLLPSNDLISLDAAALSYVYLIYISLGTSYVYVISLIVQKPLLTVQYSCLYTSASQAMIPINLEGWCWSVVGIIVL